MKRAVTSGHARFCTNNTAHSQVQLHVVPDHFVVTASDREPEGGGRRQIFCFDSLINFKASCIARPDEEPTALQRQLLDVYGPDTDLILAACPQQPHGSNACAVYACLCAWTLCTFGLEEARSIIATFATEYDAPAASSTTERLLRVWLAECLQLGISNRTIATWQPRMTPSIAKAPGLPVPPDLLQWQLGLCEQDKSEVANFESSHSQLNVSAATAAALASLKAWERENRQGEKPTCSFAFVPFCAAVEGMLSVCNQRLTLCYQVSAAWTLTRGPPFSRFGHAW